ncbi:hypothetical protein GCM10007391_33380 [Alteromonas halophila]|uniref:tRNA-uridine aminocarboxypropyltransferase n=1 Tax=Alteromonas halophila TaxID=516698 RepID=A0A918N120_9ALTE|nr:hypothetical protein GCM10007391_33380 [Alteromonas halophila]
MSAPAIVLQHPKEQKHAKNTARLAQLCSRKVTVINTSDADAMQKLRIHCDATSSALIYPAEYSRPLEDTAFSEMPVKQWLFLDGSWKQAYAMLHQHPFLQALPAYHFASPPDSAYHIRHTQKINSLSTLEAIAYCMHQVYQDDVSPLYSLQKVFVERWRAPAAHRR